MKKYMKYLIVGRSEAMEDSATPCCTSELCKFWGYDVSGCV